MTGATTRSAAETRELGRRLARDTRPGDIIALIGTLGSGKTCLTAGICDGLGVRAAVASPTFTLINEYPAPFGTVVHVDLYRIGRREELAELGLEEYFTPRHICLIEWAEKVLDLLPADARVIRISHGREQDERVFRMESAAGRGHARSRD